MDTKITCIILDDEPLARELMTLFVDQTPHLELVAQFENGAESFHFLQNNNVDLVFSDIEMPDINGMELAKSLKNAPYFIFTTAYEQYAVDGFDIGAIDYIKKPVTYARFLKAVQKAEAVVNLKTMPKDENDFFVRADGILHRIKLTEIKYLETMGDYVKIHLNDGTTVVQLSSMKAMEDRLPKHDFFRIHTSFIIPLKNIRKIFGNMVVLNSGEELPVAKPRKQELYHKLNIKED